MAKRLGCSQMHVSLAVAPRARPSRDSRGGSVTEGRARAARFGLPRPVSGRGSRPNYYERRHEWLG